MTAVRHSRIYANDFSACAATLLYIPTLEAIMIRHAITYILFRSGRMVIFMLSEHNIFCFVA